MDKRIVIFCGDKGGVGKTTAAVAYADGLIARGIEFLPLDADQSNPDFFERYENGVAVDHQDFENWAAILEAPENIVLNLPAGGGSWIWENRDVLSEAAQAAGKSIDLYFVVNRDRESANILQKRALPLLKLPAFASLTVVRNLFFGPPEKFSILEDARRDITSAGGKIIDFPELNDLVARDVANSGKRPAELLRDGGIGFIQTPILRAWLKSAHEAFFGDYVQETAPKPAEASV